MDDGVAVVGADGEPTAHPSDPSEQQVTPPPDLPPKPALTAAAAGIVGFGMAVAWLLGARLGLSMDDIAMFGLANREQPWDPSYLLLNWAGHFLPAGIALSWLAARAFGLDATGYAVVDALGVGAVLWLSFTLFRRIIGNSWLTLVPLVFLATSYALYSAGTWWSTSLITLPLLILTLLTLRQLIPPRVSGTATAPQPKGHRQLAVLIVLQTMAYLGNERALLLPPIVFAVLVAWEPLPLRRAVAGVWRRWRSLWIAEAVLAAGFVGLYLLSMSLNPTRGFTVFHAENVQQFPSQLGLMLQALPTSFFGGPIHTVVPILATPPDWFLAVAMITFALIVAAALIISPLSRRLATVSLAIAFISMGLVVLGGRATAGHIMQPRYYVHTSIWLALALAATLAAARTHPALRDRSRALGLAFLAATICWTACWSITLINVVAQAQAIHQQPGDDPWRSYLRAAEKLPAGTQLLDTDVEQPPFDIVPLITGRPLSQSEAYGRLLPNIDYTDGPATLIRYLPDQGGFYATDVVGPSATPKPPACVSTSNPTTTVTLTSRLYRLRHFVHATGTGPATSQIRVQLDDAPGGTLRLGGNQTTSYTWVTGETDTVTLTLENGPGACITTLTIGPAEPRQRLTP